MFARISDSRGGALGPLDAFAGGALPTTVLSCCARALLPLLSSAAVLPLRATCREAAAAIAQHPWEDGETLIKGRVRDWRACFPRARAANLAGKDLFGRSLPVRITPLADAELVHLAGLRTLNIMGRRELTDAAFVHLRGLRALNMSFCSQEGITDAAFVHLRGIYTLHMSYCSQAGITDATFAHLCGIHTLVMSSCSQAGITDAAFAHLRGIHTLHMSFCIQVGITGAAFAHLRGIRSLGMLGCRSALVESARDLGLMPSYG